MAAGPSRLWWQACPLGGVAFSWCVRVRHIAAFLAEFFDLQWYGDEFEHMSLFEVVATQTTMAASKSGVSERQITERLAKTVRPSLVLGPSFHAYEAANRNNMKYQEILSINIITNTIIT